MSHKLHTTLVFVLGNSERELPATIVYTARPGYPATQEEPGCDATAEILSILVNPEINAWLHETFADDADLLNECMADWRDDQGAAAEYRAEQRADDRMMERFA